jgi:hypothetical protein
MPLKFWDEAFSIAAFLINRLPSHVLNFSSPFEKLFSTTPDYNWLKVFGCACWSHLRPYNVKKLEFCSKRCVFLGYSSNHKGYKCLDVATGCVYISRDVVFDENVFPFDELHENAGAQLPVDILLLPPSLRNFHGHDIVDDLRAYSANLGSEVDGVQVENIIAEARTQQGATGVENSIAEAMDLAGALDPQAQSTSNHTSADGQASSSDRRPDLASSAHARAATPGSVPGLDPSAATSASAPDSPMATSPSDTR